MRKLLSQAGAHDRDSAGAFVVIQTVVFILLATWSLGGRADGAISWIGMVSWCSLVAVILDSDRRRFLPRSGIGWILAASWVLVFLFLLVAPLNAQLIPVEFPDGNTGLQPLQPALWLPSALVAYRSAEYGFLLSGAMVQALVLWHYLRSRRQIRLLLGALAVNALVLAIVGAFIRQAGVEKILGFAEPVHPGFFASFRYHNHWVAFAVLSLGQFGALMAYNYRQSFTDPRIKKRRPDIFWLCAIVLLSITLPMTSARFGTLLLLLFWLVLFAVLAKIILRSRSEFPREGSLFQSTIVRIFGLTLIALAALVYVFWLNTEGYDRTRETLDRITALHEVSDDAEEPATFFQILQQVEPTRFDYTVKDTAAMIRSRPLLGWGFGSHKYAFYFFAGDHYRDAEGFPRVHKEFAHSDWLQFVAELGALVFAALLLVPLVQWVRLRRQGPPPAVTRWLFFGCALVLLMATIEFPLSNPAVLVLFFVQATTAFAYWKEESGKKAERLKP